MNVHTLFCFECFFNSTISSFFLVSLQEQADVEWLFNPPTQPLEFFNSQLSSIFPCWSIFATCFIQLNLCQPCNSGGPLPGIRWFRSKDCSLIAKSFFSEKNIFYPNFVQIQWNYYFLQQLWLILTSVLAYSTQLLVEIHNSHIYFIKNKKKHILLREKTLSNV